MDFAEISRYVLNGVLATVVHFSVLYFNIEVLGFESAGMSNLVAAFFGISASYLGNRYFVFKQTDVSVAHQAGLFAVLYSLIALGHGLILFAWSDIYLLDYRIGFIIATGVQFLLSYTGNKFLVFRQ
ncbi:MAG: putative flippase GtrA [Halieaceae bacterium]|jgi:putative flippase GtrA